MCFYYFYLCIIFSHRHILIVLNFMQHYKIILSFYVLAINQSILILEFRTGQFFLWICSCKGVQSFNWHGMASDCHSVQKVKEFLTFVCKMYCFSLQHYSNSTWRGQKYYHSGSGPGSRVTAEKECVCLCETTFTGSHIWHKG